MNTTATASAALVAEAQALLPELVARSQEIDNLRHLPQDLAQRMADLGFYRLVAPEDLGGLGIAPDVFCEICETLATANGSAVWCIFIGATSQYLRRAADVSATKNAAKS